MISIRGIGWLTKEGYGCIRTGLRNEYESSEGIHILQKKDIFSHPFKNFGRLDAISRMTAYAAALALSDAGIEYSPERKQDIGIIGTNAEGSLRSDIEYFRDYVKGGRTLSRGNLFIYTLPSSPVGESAIHFGFLGPLLYAVGPDNSLLSVLDTAAEMVLANETPVMLTGKAEEGEAVFFVFDGISGHASPVLCDFPIAREIVDMNPDVTGIVRQFEVLTSGKG